MAGTNYAVAPGEYLEEWVDEHGLSLQAAAGLLGYSHEQVNEIISGRVPITAETATRLARVTGITARSWLRYEAAYRAATKRPRQGHWSRYLPGTGWGGATANAPADCWYAITGSVRSCTKEGSHTEHELAHLIRDGSDGPGRS